MKSEEILHRVKEERNVLHTLNRKKANWVGQILRRNCLLKRVIEGKVEDKIQEEEDVSSYWMNLRKREVSGS